MEQKEFLAHALRQSRNLSGLSQEYVSFELGVARKTVQNWEKGVSEPTIDQALNWFKTVKVSPLPYLFQYVYPQMENISSADHIEELRKSLMLMVEAMPEEAVRQVLYLFYGDHGSAPRAVLNMVTAHLQTPMRDRVVAGSVILKNYEMAKKQGNITDENHVQPDVELLRHAINKGEEAAVANEDCYVPV